MIVIAGIAYLQPAMASQRGFNPHTVIDADAFAESMRIVLRGDQDEDFLDDSGAEVSTPLMRRAVRYRICQVTTTAVHRRRQGMIIHLLLVVIGVVVPFVLPVSHWWSLAPVGLLVWWLVLCRISVKTVARLVTRLEGMIQEGDGEMTMIICDDDEPSVVVETERSIEITGNLVDRLQSLLEPIPVTPTTYLSRPLLPRSVRTIDLSAPVSSSELGMPVVAPGENVAEHRRVSGE